MINWNVTSPLQEYCFGAACDLWDTTTVLFCSVHEDLLENTSTKIKVFAPFPSGIQGQNETDGWMDGRRGRWQHYLTRTRRVSIYNKYTPIKTANLHRKDYLNTTCVWFASALVYCSLYLIALVIRCFLARLACMKCDRWRLVATCRVGNISPRTCWRRR